MNATNRRPLPALPPDYLTLDINAPRSATYKCGAQFADDAQRWSFPDYDVAPGATVPITISFHGKDGSARRPKGDLRLTTTRGKLSATRLKLDGKADKVTVQYAAPDETIKVSLRAFLDGYSRGKAHLHLG